LYIEAESTYFEDGNVPAVDNQVRLYLADRSLIVNENALHVLLSGILLIGIMSIVIILLWQGERRTLVWSLGLWCDPLLTI